MPETEKQTHEFKILSIDGGGIKGLYSAVVLAHLEEKFKCRLVDCFDMICGTSTGGLIALGLASGKSAQELVDFYEQEGPAIFGHRNTFTALLKQLTGTVGQVFVGGKYGHRRLEAAVTKVLGADTRMSQAQALLCIPSFNLMKGWPRVFKFPHPEGDIDLNKYGRMVDVALATTAAPTYFPIAAINGSYYVDGGVWANNPTLCGVLEALRYFVGPGKTLQGKNAGKEFSEYSILSIGSVQEYSAWSLKGRLWQQKWRKRGFVSWQDKLFQTSLDGQAQFADNFTSKLIHWTKAPGHYHRISSPALSAEQQAVIGLDKASSSAISLLKTLGNQVGEDYRSNDKIGLIAPFFSHPKQYLTH